MNDLSKLRDQIKSTVTMDDVCERLGIRVPADRKIHSIYRNEKTPSLHLYKADFYDYSTGQGGDVIRFVMDHQGWSFPKAVRWIARASSNTFVTTRNDDTYSVEPADLTALFRSAVGEASWQVALEWERYAQKKWGLSLRTILTMGSTIAGAAELWTPHCHDGVVRGIKVRTIDGQKRSVKGSQYTHGLYRTASSVTGAGTAWIVEGESDTWALEHWFSTNTTTDDPTVYGLPSGATLWRDEWRNSLAGHSRVIVALDNDDAGTDGLERILGSLRTPGWGGPSAYGVFPPGGRVAEALMAGSAPYDWLQIA